MRLAVVEETYSMSDTLTPGTYATADGRFVVTVAQDGTAFYSSVHRTYPVEVSTADALRIIERFGMRPETTR
jgi:hypothetical protein